MTDLLEQFNKLKELAPQPRGRAFERFLGNIFTEEKVRHRLSYRPTGEGIDGAFWLFDRTFLLDGTDQRNGVSFDQKDGSALGGWTGHDAIGAYAGIARHVAKSAESNRTGDLAWQSSERTGRPGVRAC